jgi:hypothetical protein
MDPSTVLPQRVHRAAAAGAKVNRKKRAADAAKPAAERSTAQNHKVGAAWVGARGGRAAREVRRRAGSEESKGRL